MKKIKLLFHILRWRFSWSRKDLDFKPKGEVSNKFISARDAAKFIPDGACVVSNGFAGAARCSVFFWAIREAFLKTGHPRLLTWINVAAQGSRGRVPGTVEEMGLPDLMKEYITGHHETAKAQLKLAQAGHLELHTMPQGVMTHIFEAQSKGKTYHLSDIGLQTFVDPRVGEGTSVTPNAQNQYVEYVDGGLKYTLPKIEVALINVPYADAEGNLYFKHAATLTENLVSAKAARANGGLVMATVTQIIPKDTPSISMPAEEVDYIVMHPHNEQTASIRQRKYWPMFTEGSQVDFGKATEKLRFINSFLKITPVRNELDQAVARLAAKVFVEVVPKGAMANIGVGYPEEVARHLVQQGLQKDILFTTEAGAYGGLPTAGIFFGSAIGPEKLISSLEMFKLYKKRLGVAVLGFLQVDSKGNVNASKRGPNITDFVGPGGFPDIVDGARTVIFIGSWMARADFKLENAQIKLRKRGIPKFVDQVDQITFAASEGLRKGKQVYYITHVGVFKLTQKGLQLIQIMPGVDVQKDILEACAAKIQLPDGTIPVVDASVITGKGFQLKWKENRNLVVENS